MKLKKLYKPFYIHSEDLLTCLLIVWCSVLLIKVFPGLDIPPAFDRAASIIGALSLVVWAILLHVDHVFNCQEHRKTRDILACRRWVADLTDEHNEKEINELKSQVSTLSGQISSR